MGEKKKERTKKVDELGKTTTIYSHYNPGIGQ